MTPTYADAARAVHQAICRVLVDIGDQAVPLIPQSAALIGRAFTGDHDAAGDAAWVALAAGKTGHIAPIDAAILAEVLARQADKRGGADDHMRLASVLVVQIARERVLGNPDNVAVLEAEFAELMELAASKGNASADAVVPAIVETMSRAGCALLQAKKKRGR